VNGRGCNRGRGEGPEGRCTPGEVWDGVHAPRVRKALACGAPGSGRSSRWHSKGGRLCHVYMARAPARSQPEAAARSNVPTCPAYLGEVGGRAKGWPSRWRGCAARAGLRRVCGWGGGIRRGGVVEGGGATYMGRVCVWVRCSSVPGHGTRPTPSRGKTPPGPGGGPQPLPVSPVDLRASRVWSVQGGVGRAGGGRRAPRCLYPQDGGIRRPPCGLRVYGVA